MRGENTTQVQKSFNTHTSLCTLKINIITGVDFKNKLHFDCKWNEAIPEQNSAGSSILEYENFCPKVTVGIFYFRKNQSIR